MAERLARNFDVYVLDVRGRGLSATGPELEYSLDACAADVAALAAALGLENYILLGHSKGARIGIRTARRLRGAMTRLVLVDPPVSGPGRRAYPSNVDWYIDSIRLSRAGMGVEAVRRFCPSWSEKQLRLRAEWLHTCDETAVRKTYAGFHDEDVHGDMPFLDLPTLLVVAMRGGVTQPEDEAELSGLRPALGIVRVRGAGNMIPWNNFEGFFDAVDPFLHAQRER